MLPTAVALTPEVARRWVAAGVPRWVPRIALTVAWASCIAINIAADTRPCSTEDLTVCGPDQAFAWWAVVALATPVLLVWLPLLGCLAGTAFAAADLVYDDVQPSRIAFGLHGLGCLLVGFWLVRAARAQEEIATAAAGPLRATVPLSPRGEDPRRPHNVLRLGAAGMLLVAAVGLFGWYRHVVGREESHLARAVEVTGRSVVVDEDDTSVRFEVADPATGTTRRIDIGVFDTGPYAVGQTAPVLLDSGDPSWARLVAEPEDQTGWKSAAIGAVALALLLLLRELEWYRARKRLWSGTFPALTVDTVPNEKGDALVLPASADRARLTAGDGSHAAVTMPVAWGVSTGGGDGPSDDSTDVDGVDEETWDLKTQESFGRAWRGEQEAEEDERFDTGPPEREPAVLLGTLRDRGWAVLITEDGVLVPSGPLAVKRIPDTAGATTLGRLKARLPLGRRRDAGDQARDADEGHGLPGQPVRPGLLRREPDLPLVLRHPRSQRAVGALMAGAGVVGAPAVISFLAEDWYQRGISAVIGGQLLVGGVARFAQRVVLTRERLEVVGAMRVNQVPWDRLHGVRQNAETLVVAWEPDVVVEVGPFQPVAASTGRVDVAEQTGAAMLVLRERSTVAGRPEREVTARPGPAWPLLTGYAVIVALALWSAFGR